MEQKEHLHGGDLDRISRIYRIPKEEILDFSGNINPLGFPPAVEKALAENTSLVTTYPDKEYRVLREAISQYTGASMDHILVGNGSTDLIATFIKLAQGKPALILGPAYSEYERELTLLQTPFQYVPLAEKNDFVLDTKTLLEKVTPDVGLLILCNPNNPTGSGISISAMEEILSHCKNNETMVMVDETYIEFSNRLEELCSIALVKDYDNLFVIRGVSKFFAAPGLRLGYGISSNHGFLQTFRTTQPPWSVNSLAAFCGEQLFLQKGFMEKTKQLISTEREKAYHELSTWKQVKVYPSDANFLLLRLLDETKTADQIFEEMIQKKFLIRDAHTFQFLDKSFLRFCLLFPDQNAALLAALKEILEVI